MFFLPQSALFNHVGRVVVNYPSDVQESLGEKRPFAQHPKRGHLIITLAAMTGRYLNYRSFVATRGAGGFVFLPGKEKPSVLIR